MAMTTIDKMKDIFNGPKTLLYSKAITDLSKASVDITPEIELPVEVDSLKATMDGSDHQSRTRLSVLPVTGRLPLSLGDFNVEFVVPSKGKGPAENHVRRGCYHRADQGYPEGYR